VVDDSSFNLTDFDRYLEEHKIPEEHLGRVRALSLNTWTGGFPRSRRSNRRAPADRVVIEGDDL
jgi:hypothetical protein